MSFKNIVGTDIVSLRSRFVKVCSFIFHKCYSWGINIFGTYFHFVLFALLILCLGVETLLLNSFIINTLFWSVIECIFLAFSVYICVYIFLTFFLLSESKRRRSYESAILKDIKQINNISYLNKQKKRLNTIIVALESLCRTNSLEKISDANSLVSLVNLEVMSNVENLLCKYGINVNNVWFPKIYTDKFYSRTIHFKKRLLNTFKRKDKLVPKPLFIMDTKAYNCAMYDMIMLNEKLTEGLIFKMDSLRSTWVTTLCHEYLHMFMKNELLTSLFAVRLLSKSSNYYVLLSLCNSLLSGITSTNMSLKVPNFRSDKKLKKNIEMYTNYILYYDFNELYNNSIIKDIEEMVGDLNEKKV